MAAHNFILRRGSTPSAKRPQASPHFRARAMERSAAAATKVKFVFYLSVSDDFITAGTERTGTSACEQLSRVALREKRIVQLGDNAVMDCGHVPILRRALFFGPTFQSGLPGRVAAPLAALERSSGCGRTFAGQPRLAAVNWPCGSPSPPLARHERG